MSMTTKRRKKQKEDEDVGDDNDNDDNSATVIVDDYFKPLVMLALQPLLSRLLVLRVFWLLRTCKCSVPNVSLTSDLPRCNFLSPDWPARLFVCTPAARYSHTSRTNHKQSRHLRLHHSLASVPTSQTYVTPFPEKRKVSGPDANQPIEDDVTSKTIQPKMT